MTVRILVGDALAQLRTLDAESVQCCVTSPPYYGLRDYGVAGQLGLERTPDEYVARMVEVFREVRRVLRKDGTLWLNIGDSYAGGKQGRSDHGTGDPTSRLGPRRDGLPNGMRVGGAVAQRDVPPGLKPKDLIGIPWMLGFALRADGWYLRSDIIWAKPNPMPESVTDRPTKAHEYVFLLSKSATYFYDADAIAEPIADASAVRLAQDVESQEVSDRVPGKTNGPMKAVVRMPRGEIGSPSQMRALVSETGDRYMSGRVRAKHAAENGLPLVRNKRTVWDITTQPFKESHFATMPPELAETCILAGCPKDGTVLDPFGGAGTTGLVADRLSRHALLIELNPAYAEMARARIQNDNPMFTQVEVA